LLFLQCEQGITMKIIIALAAISVIVLALPRVLSAAPDPVDEKAVVPPVKYQSPFRDYRALGDVKPVAWKDANDEVGRIGGWRTYAKEVSEPPSPPAAGSATSVPTPTVKQSSPVKAEPGHAGHGQPK
jgi:hypothetical protein